MLLSDFSYSDETFRQLEMARETAVSDTDFTDCILDHCQFPEGIFQTCRFVGCTFKHCEFNLARFPKTSFSRCTFDHCSLIGINWTEATWPRTTLQQPLRFTHCKFVDVERQDPIGRLHDVDFREADLTRATFKQCDLEKSRFQQTNLSHADLRTAKNYSINPSKNTLTKAKFALPEALSLLYSLNITLEESA